MSSMPSAGLIYLGMDTSMNTIVVGVLRPGEEMPVVDRVFNDEESIRRLIGRFPDRRVLSACYEAGPGGYELYRLLSEESRVFRTAVLVVISCCVLPVQELVVDLTWGLIAET